MVALFMRGGIALAGDTPLGVRLAAPLAALLGSWLLARAARDLAPGRDAATPAVLLLNATLVLGAGAVVLTPDTPLLLFWTATIAALARLIRTGNGWWWLAVGAGAGLAMASKYTAILLGPAILLWLVWVPAARRWWRDWRLYAAKPVAWAAFGPVVWWNASHHWASFARQGGRALDFAPAQAARHLAELFLGQIGLATPVVAVALGIGFAGIVPLAWRRDSACSLLVFLAAVPAAVFLEHALGDRVQANWPAVLYPGLALAAGIAGARVWRVAAATGFALTVLVYAQAAGRVLPLPRHLDPTLIRLAGWSDLASEVGGAARQAGAAFVAADEYGLASSLAFRMGRVVGAEPRWKDIALPRVALEGRRGLLVISDRRGGAAPDPALWRDPVLLGHAARDGAETYRLFAVTGAPGAMATALPAPAAHTGAGL